VLEDRLGGATVASGLLGKEGIDCILEHFAVKAFVIDQTSKGDHFGSELVAGFGVHAGNSTDFGDFASRVPEFIGIPWSK
jgi:hypothetical protein